MKNVTFNEKGQEKLKKERRKVIQTDRQKVVIDQ